MAPAGTATWMVGSQVTVVLPFTVLALTTASGFTGQDRGGDVGEVGRPVAVARPALRRLGPRRGIRECGRPEHPG
jgi:hypothetical protein